MDRLAADRPPALEGAMEPARDRLMGPEERAGAGRRRAGSATGQAAPWLPAPAPELKRRRVSSRAEQLDVALRPNQVHRRVDQPPAWDFSPPQSQGRGASAVRPPTGSRGAGAAVARRVASLANPQPVHKRARNRARNCLPDDPQAGYEPSGRGVSPGPCGKCPFIRACNGNPASPFAWLACRVVMTRGPIDT